MFVALLTYVRPLEEVDALIPAHAAFLEQHYASGLFIASGRRAPRTGGVILIAHHDRGHVEQVLQADPFRRHAVATCELVEFVPSMFQPGFRQFT